MAKTIRDFFLEKLKRCGLVLVNTHSVFQQTCKAEIGRVYRAEHLFADKWNAIDSRHIEFIGSGGTWGETPNYAGEVGFAFLNKWEDHFLQANWHGHIPVERHSDGLWCLLYVARLRHGDDVPQILRENSKPNVHRVRSTGEPFETWIRFEAMEAYLKSLIAELEGKPCEPIEVTDVEPWLRSTRRAEEHLDVLIVGAGLSGIGAAYHLQANCPGRSYAILEGRERSGGTWDLFRYPGIRSDSDMYTLGYSFRPWTQAKAIADGPSILKYVRETAEENGIDGKIRFNHRVVHASWSTADACWTVEVERSPGPGPGCEPYRIRCNFLFMCSGYYNYEAGYTPEFEGRADFQGRIVHPQHWPEDLDHKGKRVVVIGSGATAMTLVPEMAKTAAHVTLLQRSPTYVVARPSSDPIANRLRRRLPAKWAYGLTRWKNVTLSMLFFRLARRKPDRARKMLLDGVRMALGPQYDIATHFTPRYNPWQQRLCLVPDGDLFAALNAGRASMVTDHIDRFTPQGIKLQSGAELEADLIVTATGLDLQVLGGIALEVDGKPVDPAATFNYKGMMYSDVPNLASSFGYTNASWTLKCDLTCEYVCRVLNHMDKKGWRQCTPRNGDAGLVAEPWLDFSSGYVQRSLHKFPKQGARAPWKLYQNYARDILSLRFGRVDDGVMEFSNRAA